MSENKRKISLDNVDISKIKIPRKGECTSRALNTDSSLLCKQKDDLHNNDRIILSQTSNECGFNCGLCCKTVDTSEIEISSLQCCLCNTYYHGCCLDLDDDVLALLVFYMLLRISMVDVARNVVAPT